MRIPLWRYTAIVSVVVMLAGCSGSSPTSTATTTPTLTRRHPFPLRRVETLPPRRALGELQLLEQAPLDGFGLPDREAA